MKTYKMYRTNFENNVIAKLQREGFIVSYAKRHCGFELMSTNPLNRAAGIKVKPHGHLTIPEKRKLLSHHMPMFVAREGYSGDANDHVIKIERITLK